MMDQGLRKPIVKTGWLAKTGGAGGLTGWKDRYCVLAQGKITYYKSEKTTDPQGFVDLSKCIKVEPLSLKKGYGFQIEMPDRTYHFSAEKEEDRNAWITAVMEATASLAIRSGSISSVKSSSFSTTTAELSVSGEEKADDDIVSLLEAQVESLKQALNSAQSKLKTVTAMNESAENQLAQSLSEHNRFVQKSAQEKAELQKQMEQLQSIKLKLETVNDSMTAQLEEHKKKEEQLEEELEEVQRAMEQDKDTSQSQLADMEHKSKQQEHLIQQLEAELKAKDASLSAANATLTEDRLKQQSLEQEMAKKHQSLLEHEKASVLAEKQKAKELEMALQKLRKELNEKDSTTAAISDQKQKWQAEKDELLRNHAALLEQSKITTTTDKKKLMEYEELIQQLKSQIVNKDKQIEKTDLFLSEERIRWQTEKEELTKQAQAISELHRVTAEEGRKKVQELEGSIQQLKMQLKNKDSSLQAATTALTEEKTRSGLEKEEVLKKHQVLLEQERNAAAAEKKLRKEMETVMQKLKEELGNRDNSVQLSASLVQSEERLKWQAEKEELIREHQALLDRERTSNSEEKKALQDTIHTLQRKSEELELQFDEKRQQLELQCQQAQSRIDYLENDILALKDQLSGLQVQKDKALADLSTIRKTNKDMERRLSESETIVSAMKNKSPSALDNLQEEPVHKWDSNTPGQDVLQPPPVRTKTEPTIGATSVSPSSPTYIPPEKIVDPVLPAANPGGAPPPKPKRPPAELINKFDVPSKPQSFMQGLFARLQ